MTLLISATTEGRDLVGAESFVSVVKTATSEGIKEELAEERSVIDVVSMRLEEIPQVPVTARDDDGFVELDVVHRETSYVPPGITKIFMCVFHKNFGSLVLYFVLCCYIRNLFVASYLKTLL